MTTVVTGSEAVGTLLASVHDHWIERMAGVLSPLMRLHPGARDRWIAARHVAEQLEPELLVEYELAEALGPWLAPSRRVRLATLRSGLGQAAAELARWPAPLAARRLLDLARCWCVELELATARITRDDLSGTADHLLARLEER